MNRFTEEEFHEFLKATVNSIGEEKFAVDNSINKHLLHDILTGSIRCPGNIAKKLGYSRELMYKELEKV